MPRTGNNGSGFTAINLATDGGAEAIFLDSSGQLQSVNPGGDAFGIRTVTNGTGSSITIENSGDSWVEATGGDDTRALGIYSVAVDYDSPISIVNSGDFWVEATGADFTVARGIYAETSRPGNSITIVNSGDMWVEVNGTGTSSRAYGIDADTIGFTVPNDGNKPVAIHNSGDITVTATASDGPYGDARAITAGTQSNSSRIDIHNSGHITATAGDDARGIGTRILGDDSPTTIHNSGDITLTAGDEVTGIEAYTDENSPFSTSTNSPITIHNSGDITGSAGGEALGIIADAYGPNSPVSIWNTGNLKLISGSGDYARGITVIARDDFSPVKVENHGAMTVLAKGEEEDADGIKADTYGDNSRIEIKNSGDFDVQTRGYSSSADGIEADTDGDNSDIEIKNSGDFDVRTRGDFSSADGIEADTDGDNSRIEITNSGDFDVQTRGNYSSADGIEADADSGNSKIGIHNSGDLTIETRGTYSSAEGIDAYTEGPNSDIEVRNSGNITATAGQSRADGIKAESDGSDSDVTVYNSGELRVEAGGASSSADGIDGDTYGSNSRLKIVNSGNMWVKTSGENSADGIDALAEGNNSGIEIHNSGDMTIEALDGTGNQTAGIEADSGQGYGGYGVNSGIKVVNSGNLNVTTGGDDASAEGIGVSTTGEGSEIDITNHGDLVAEVKGDSEAFGILADSSGINSPIDIENSGSVYAKGGTRNVGIQAYSRYANKTIIINTGSIGAESHRAIDVKGGGTARVDNAGTITGFVDLTSQDDVFNNQSGGVFEAKKTSLFGAGDDLFTNRSGGTVQAATDVNKSEMTVFEGLETFKNAGLISMVDGKEGDAFTISNTPGGTDLDYHGNGGTLGVDSFLGGPGSKSDTFTIEGDVSGKTEVAVTNTNPGGGAFNAEGIPVVFATGETPNADAFRLDGPPVEAGFFNYDLFFEPTGSGQWELRSFAGGGAHLLPQLLTAAQDIWHQSSSTWFDRTADLRVLMHGGPAPAATGGKSLNAAPVQDQLAPAVWLKGGGSWLDRDATASTSAYGRTYKFNLDRELETVDIQIGIDFASRDVLGAGDALVFGVLGGFVHGDLDYDSLARRFQYEGGQVGVYATYLSEGLFVDTLLNAHLTELDTNTRGFAGSLDANTVGLRTDAGYRFGSFSGGAFIEPLGTIEVMWADIDGFSQGGNRVSFDDEANVRGRLGLRAGTTSEVWEGTLMEPFIIGSLWSHLSGDNQATLVSSGRTFRFQDDLEDVWGEVSAGVNFFNFTETTSVFGKVDVTFGDDVTGLGGKAGMRVAW